VEEEKVDMKKKVSFENYLERIPKRAEYINWRKDENDNITLIIENKGIFNRLAQCLLKKPKVSFIHLDEMGSFIWERMDGRKNILDLGKEVEERFKESANPLYERLAKYIQILESYNFISNKK